MVRNGIEQALAVEGFGITCIHDNARLITIANATNITCGALKVHIAVSLAFTSGLIMVSGKYVGLLKDGNGIQWNPRYTWDRIKVS